MINHERLVSEFMQLVQIDSETLHEQQISVALAEKFAALGLTVQEDETMAITGHGANNLIATLSATIGYEDIPTIFFTSHMDTVAPGIGIKPQRDADGYIRSDGTTILAADDKAGIAAMLEAIRVLEERHISHGAVQFVITVGEEAGLKGARAMSPDSLSASYGFAIDSNGAVGDIAVAAPSQAKIHITVWGRAAHAGVNPEDGLSAIQVAAKAISRMPHGRIDHETTANIGRFEGGGATNIVTERVDLDAEARSIVQEKLDRQVIAMRTAFEQAAAEFGGRVDFNSEIIYPAYCFNENDEIVQMAKQALSRLGYKPRTFHSGGGSDANIFNGLGIPTLNLSVGYEYIHTTKEQIAEKNLAGVAGIVVALVEEAAQTI